MSETAQNYEEQYEGQELSVLLDRSIELREQAAELSKQEKDLRAEKEIVDQVIISIMESLGVSRTGNDSVNASVQNKKLPSVVDWEAFYAYVNEHNASYLFQRRVSQKAVEELLELTGDIPGIEIFEKTALSLRKS